MFFGIAKEMITPPFKMRLACTSKEECDFEDIHDDIFVRCLIFDDGNAKSVMMSFDLLFHDRTLNESIAEYANEKYGISKSSVCVSYTHSHTAPAVKGYNPMHHDDRYEEILIERGKSCIDKAMSSVFEGYFEYGSMDIDLNISRRGCVDGVYKNAPNFNYEHDTELFVMCIKDMKDKIRSVLVNYACHPVFYPALLSLSGEFPTRLCQLLDAKYYDSTSIFFQSAAGDVRPAATVTTREDGSYKWAWMNFDAIDIFSHELLDRVEKLINSDKMKKGELSVCADAFSVELQMAGASFETFEKEWEHYKKHPGNANATNAELIVNGGYENLSDSLELFCQIIRLTDKLFVVAVGGEPCYGIKRAIGDVLGGYDVCFIGYTDSCAYIVDDRVLSEGGYEAECHLEYGLKGPFKAGITKRISEAFEDSLKKLEK